MYFVYLIYSPIHDRFYCGHTENIDDRLKMHHSGKVSSTKAFKPWIVVYSENFEAREDAIARERYFKSGAGRRYLKEIKEGSRVPRPNAQNIQ